MKTINGYHTYFNELKEYKNFAITACEDFCYEEVMPDCIKRIQSATSTDQIVTIMETCRKRMFA